VSALDPLNGVVAWVIMHLHTVLGNLFGHPKEKAYLMAKEVDTSGRVIVLTTYEGDALAYRALKAGARAYILKSLVRKELLSAIRAVHAGHKHIQSEIAVGLADHAADDRLTDREIEVLTMIGDGNSNKIIADKLSITEHTVKGHVKSILSKLGASDRTHAVKLGLKRGITRL